VLFDFIEEMHEKGKPLERALTDAGIERIRPVMITRGRDDPCSVSSRT
jgi:multidrug efflux pump subunit AcrB